MATKKAKTTALARPAAKIEPLYKNKHFRIFPTGVQVDGQPTYDDWAAFGGVIATLGTAAQWALGDWLLYGEGRGDYGEMYSQALSVTGRSYGGLSNVANVCKRFQFPRRHGNLGFSHHQVVYLLEPAVADALLAQAEAHNWSVDELRDAKRKVGFPVLTTPDLPAGRFALLYGDPPWRYEHVVSESRAIENQYPTMDLAAICALPVPAADDAILFLWATSPKLAEAMTVLSAWGFTYRTCAVWDKEVIGMGYYFRQQHELLLVATKGDPMTPAPGDRVSSVIRSRRGAHSAKPEAVYTILEAMYPSFGERERCELFQRTPRAGWTGWGNEV